MHEVSIGLCFFLFRSVISALSESFTLQKVLDFDRSSLCITFTKEFVFQLRSHWYRRLRCRRTYYDRRQCNSGATRAENIARTWLAALAEWS